MFKVNDKDFSLKQNNYEHLILRSSKACYV